MYDVFLIIQSMLWVAVVAAILTIILQSKESFKKLITKYLEEGDRADLLSSKVETLKHDISDIHDHIELIDLKVANLFLTAMPSNMYFNLKKIHSGNFGCYCKTEGLVRELYHLSEIAYIKVTSINDLPAEGENLSKYVSITPKGVQFVEFKERVEFISKIDNSRIRPNSRSAELVTKVNKAPVKKLALS